MSSLGPSKDKSQRMTSTTFSNHSDSSKGSKDKFAESSFFGLLLAQRFIREEKKLKRQIHNGDNLSEQRLNFRARISDKRKEFESALWFYETKMLMHRLSFQYYNFRAKWLTFMPILAVTSLTSIVGFFTSTDFISPGWTNALALTSGFLGVISTALASCSKYNNYQSKADMHISAFRSMSTIVDGVKLDLQTFEQVTNTIDKDMSDGVFDKSTYRPPTKSDNNNDDDDNGTTMDADFQKDEMEQNKAAIEKFKKTGAQLNQYRTQYQTMKSTCSSPFPGAIQVAFRTLRQAMGPGSHDFKKYLYPRLYFALWHHFKKQPLFPLAVSNVNVHKWCKEELKYELETIFNMDDIPKKIPLPMDFYGVDADADIESRPPLPKRLSYITRDTSSAL